MRPHMLPLLVTVNRMKTAGFPWFIGEYGANGQTRELIVSDLQLLGWIWRLAVVTLAVGKVGGADDYVGDGCDDACDEACGCDDDDDDADADADGDGDDDDDGGGGGGGGGGFGCDEVR